MRFEDYKRAFSQEAIGRYDIAPVYADIHLFTHLVEDLAAPFVQQKIDKVVAIDSLGFVLGTAVALRLKKGIILARKEGGIPISNSLKIQRSFVDYTGAEKKLELNRRLILENENLLIVDDWVEAGSQVRAVISMIEELGARVAGISCIGSDRNEKTEDLFTQYNLKSIGVNV